MQGGTIDNLITGRENKIIAVLLGLCGIFIAIIVIFAIASAARDGDGKSYMSLNIAPSTARVKIGSDEYRNGVWEMPRGKYEAEISAEGFKTKNITIEVGGGTTTVFDYLVNNENGLSYAEEDAYDLNVLRHVEENAAIKEFMIKYDRKMEIKNVLPLQMPYGCTDNEYDTCGSQNRIDIEASVSSVCKRELCLTVIDHGGGKQEDIVAAAKKLLNIHGGFNFDDYEVFYEYK